MSDAGMGHLDDRLAGQAAEEGWRPFKERRTAPDPDAGATPGSAAGGARGAAGSSAGSSRPGSPGPGSPGSGAAAGPASGTAGAAGAAAGPAGSVVDNQTLLVGVISDVRDLIASVLARLDHLDAAVAAKETDPRVVELGAAVSSIVTMLENIETAVEATAKLVPPPPVFDPATGLTARVHAAAGAIGTEALLHARVEAIEQHVMSTAADVRRLTAELSHLDESIGYLAAALLGGTVEDFEHR